MLSQQDRLELGKAKPRRIRATLSEAYRDFRPDLPQVAPGGVKSLWHEIGRCDRACHAVRETRRFAISCRLTLLPPTSGVWASWFAGVTVNLRGQSVDSTMVVGQAVQPKKPGHIESKGLT